MLNKFMSKGLRSMVTNNLVAKRSMGAFVNHRDTADNLDESPFEFT